MKLETAKSLLLIILIGTSLILTFGMWNYRAEYEPLNDDESVDKADLGGEQKQENDVIKPNDVVFKINGEFYSYVDPEDSAELFEDIQTWEITDLQNTDAEEKTADAEVEIIFPTGVPLSLFENILNIDRTLSNNMNFYVDRFYIQLQEEDQLLKVYFVSLDGDEAVEGTIHSTTNYEQLLSMFSNLTDKKFEENYLLTETARNIYIPVEEKSMESFKYTFDRTNSADVRNIMFTRPNLVSESKSAPESIMYRTDDRQLNITGHGMKFINVAEWNKEPVDKSVFQQSLENINEHAGFTDDYRLDSYTNDSVTYRLYRFQYPVINNSYMDLSTIYQRWQSDQLSEYTRSLITLDTVANTSSKKLRDSDEIISSIQQSKNIADIQDVQIGYRLTVEKDVNGEDYVLLEPDWYQRVNDSWSAVPEKNTGTQNVEGGS
ncbi:YycH family regulatory protein [Oceanobacillus sojae]|uniref:Regulatory protein YycH domain-containing protein n=1 Tax=Oceanobacillus sojae TaxID=582851 RepID=A0A511ZQ82_9BACI|nr:two-component system activity regulator YycH [Oceanobacillus sojae]GEN89613.1 hypothetical protein OSO01_43520 [Oceanobacillus sojae]